MCAQSHHCWTLQASFARAHTHTHTHTPRTHVFFYCYYCRNALVSTTELYTKPKNATARVAHLQLLANTRHSIQSSKSQRYALAIRKFQHSLLSVSHGDRRCGLTLLTPSCVQRLRYKLLHWREEVVRSYRENSCNQGNFTAVKRFV